MRILQYYRFLVGTKIPFDKWPGIIEEYLRQQHLTPRFFHYCMENSDFSDYFRSIENGTKCKTCSTPAYACERCRKEAADYLRKGTACERAYKKHPFLGPIQVLQSENAPIQYLNNFSDGSGATKEEIYAIIPQIYRRYGFSYTRLIYRDIDFFSRLVSTPMPKLEYPMAGYEGSGITLLRSFPGRDSDIILAVESHYPGEVPNAKPYADALGELLPGIKYLSGMEIIMEKDEQIRYDEMHRQAIPFIEQAKHFFMDHMPEEKGNIEPHSPVSIASCLKKLCKRYGYTYCGYSYYIYFLEKKLPSGHYICLEFVSNPARLDADPYVSLCGLGFKHEIWHDSFCPQNPRDTSSYFSKLFDVLAEAERTVFPAILELYPPTPDWFIPSH